MSVSNMKYRYVSQRISDALDSWWFLVLFVTSFALTGFIIKDVLGGLVGSVIGFFAMFAIGAEWPLEASELEWSDIELSVYNYAKCFVPGVGGIKFICKDRMFVFEKRKVFRYTEDKQFVIWYKTRKWADILNEEDDAFFSELCGKSPVRDVGLEESKTILIPQQGETEAVLETCHELIKYFIAKSGAQIENVTARDQLAVWVDPKYQEVSPVPIVRCNFKGKKDGRPVLTLTDRKGYWILHADGELEEFVDFDSWWKRAS